MLVGHLDVVGPWGPDALTRLVRDGRMYRHGAAGRKCGSAAVLLAVEAPIAFGRRRLGRRAGRPPVVRGDVAWADPGHFVEAGIPVAPFGPVGHGRHTTDEWVDLATVATTAAVPERAAQAFCA
jgi:acetylornithine deacetylase/succinyl-diaminopimelate desuccinylase-like protein